MLNIYIPGHPVKNKKHPDGCLKKHACCEKTFGTNKKHTRDRMCIKQYKPYVQHTAGDTSDIR